MGKRMLIGGVVLLAIAAIVVVNLKRQTGRKPTEVRMEKVEQKTLTATVRAPGRVQPSEYVNLSAQVPGRIVELPVEEGDTVTVGQLLLRLDDTQYRAAVESARAGMKSAEATMQLSKARVERARQTLERQKKMAAANMISPEAIEIAETELKVSEAELAARVEDRSRTEALVRSAVDDLSKTVYNAPTGGVISKLNVKLGEIVITGTMNNPGTVILTIADRSRMQVEADVDETDVVDIQEGQDASITVDALPDTTFKGRVTMIGASAQLSAAASVESATNFTVKVLFAEDVPQLRPGMTADVEVTTKVRPNAVTVPIAALVARDQKTIDRQKKEYEEKKQGGGSKALAKGKPDGGEGDSTGTDSAGVKRDAAGKEKLLEGVFITRDGVAVFVPVKTGASDDRSIEVSGDLTVGQEIVTGPYKVLRELKYGTPLKKMKGTGEKESKKK